MPGRNNTEKSKKISKLIEEFEELVKQDRSYAKRAPSFNSSIFRFRQITFQHFQILKSSNTTSRRYERDVDEEDPEKGETAFERMVREDYEEELNDCEF